MRLIAINRLTALYTYMCVYFYLFSYLFFAKLLGNFLTTIENGGSHPLNMWLQPCQYLFIITNTNPNVLQLFNSITIRSVWNSYTVHIIWIITQLSGSNTVLYTLDFGRYINKPWSFSFKTCFVYLNHYSTSHVFGVECFELKISAKIVLHPTTWFTVNIFL